MMAQSYSFYGILVLALIFIQIWSTAYSIHKTETKLQRYKRYMANNNASEPIILQRGKRHLEFGKGSRMSWRTSQKNNILTVNTLFAYGFGFRVNYPFPDPSEQRLSNRYLFKRDLFQRLETALQSHGLDGPACLLKSFCTAIIDVDSSHKKSGMLFKMLKIIFSLENDGQHHLPYLRAENCQQILHTHCPLSFNSIIPYTDEL